MDEEILTLRLLNESVALLGTKPLDSPLSQPCNLHVFWSDPAPVPTPLYCVREPAIRTRRATVPEPVTPVKPSDARKSAITTKYRPEDTHSTSRKRWAAR